MKAPTTQTARIIAARIEKGGERLWRMHDFQELPFAATAQTLSRLARQGKIQRLSKGVYYRSRPTAFGQSLPNPTKLQELLPDRSKVFPAGIAAANLLGMSTQTPKYRELATSSLSLPRKLFGKDTIIHTRRPESWNGLSDMEGALLDFLRRAGKTSERSAEDTIKRTITLLAEHGRFERLLRIAASEPPRVRALLGALGEQMGKGQAPLEELHRSLNPLSKFDFGLFAGLPYAYKWQAKGRS